MKLLAHPLGVLHPQIYLTNLCQLRCSYCSCRDRERGLVRPFDLICKDLECLQEYGAQAVTLTGGGEPLLHPQFDALVRWMVEELGVAAGLVTNGEAFGNWGASVFAPLSWTRVSMDKDRDSIPALPEGLRDPSFSYVWMPGSENDPKLKELAQRVAEGNLTHLRVVTDILSDDVFFPSSLLGVIWQDRNRSETGAKECWISLLKPVVDVDGSVFPCCGAQYALGRRGERKMPPSMRMATTVRGYVEEWVVSDRPFDGSSCRICYYGEYNRLLARIREARGLKHLEFV